ncbi:DUF6498-containing protein [Halorussus amylolyticus]|uniref:DUF6498-containing protein n=1 Tax=Halorussus amylolyticus TaxID=1126242 RepID=UPI0010456027|nr:DUF6498-containing protein [Halorussus amylolyticus]
MLGREYGRRLTAVVLSNSVLAAGVFVFGWDPHLLLLLYWVEAGVAVGREAIQSLFSALPPSEAYKPTGTRVPFPLESLSDVRGRICLVGWLPAIYPRNVPYILLTLLPLVTFWPLGGLLLTGIIAPFSGSFALPTTLTLGVFAVIFNQASHLVSWLWSGEYESAAATGSGSRKYLILVFLLAVVAPFVVRSAEDAGIGRVVLGLVVVGTKIGYDLLELRYPGFVESTVFTDKTVGEEQPIKLPDTEPIRVFDNDYRGTFVAAVVSGVLISFFGPTLFVVLLGGLVGALVGGSAFGTSYGLVVGGALGVAAVVTCRVIVEITVGWIVSAHLVYRIHSDTVVAYNTLTDAAQWSVPRSRISEVSVSPGLFSTIFPDWYSTLKIETHEGGSYKMGYFEDVESAAGLLKRESVN